MAVRALESPVQTVQGLQGGEPMPFTMAEATTPHQSAVPMLETEEEYTLVLPIGTRRFLVRPRKGVVYLSYGAGPQATRTWISAGANYEVMGLNLLAPITLRMKAKQAEEVADVEWWT
jgi:hypothetical protein